MLLLACWFARLRCHLHSAESASVLGDSSVERICNLLPVLRCFQLGRVGRVGDEGYLSQDARHVGADEHYEWCFFHATVAEGRVPGGKSAVERLLNIGRQLTGFLD